MNPEFKPYRADIDGLRAIAVVAVVLYHTFPTVLPSGYIGVDIFFVISGYLITGILLKELAGGHFSIGAFYTRRVRRIFPALCLVLVSTFAIGWHLAMPEDFQRIGKHMAAGAGFIQNFALLEEAGYFDVASDMKPLMHLWSLAIEEQFYLLYPPLLWVLWRTGMPISWAIAGLAVCSFLANIALVTHAPAATFFAPHTRLWELLAGCWLSIQHRAQGPARMWLPIMVSPNTRSALGLVALCAGLIAINSSSAFPGWWALSPVIGAMLLIDAGPTSWFNRFGLAHPAIVWVGLISYPLYLWHWPLLAYLHIGNNATDAMRATAAGLAVILSWATYRWIEIPIRNSKSGWQQTFTLVLCLVIAAYLGVNTWQRQGLGFRFNEVVGSRIPLKDLPFMAHGCGIRESTKDVEIAECMHDARGTPRFALIGDSKAAALAYGVMAMSTAENAWVFLGGNNGNGAPVPVISSEQKWQGYQALIRATIDAISNTESIKVVVVTAGARALYQLGRDDTIDDLPNAPSDIEAEAEAGLNRVMDEMIVAGKKVVLTIDNPTLLDPRRCIARSVDLFAFQLNTQLRSGPGCRIALDRHQQLSTRYHSMLSRVQARHPASIQVFDPTSLLCDKASNSCGHTKHSELLYSYTDHISAQASKMIAAELVPLAMSMANRP